MLESFFPRAALVFPRELTHICSALGKRHPEQAAVLQFTQANYRQIMGDHDRFEALGMRIFDLADQADAAVALATDASST